MLSAAKTQEAFPQPGLSRRMFMGAVTGGLIGIGSLAFTANALANPAEQPQSATESAAQPANYLYALPSVEDTAAASAQKKRLLVVVDYQVDFVDSDVFGRIEPAAALEDALYNTVKSYQDAGDLVIYTMDTHPADHYYDTREGAVNPLHCDPATEGWQVYGRVRELLTPEKAILVKKGTYGSFDLPFIVQALRNQGTVLESIEMAGVSTTCRVLHNAILLYNAFPELPIIFDATTTASYSDEQTRQQLEELESWGFIVKW